MSESRIIVALDFASAGAALEFCARLDPAQCRVKVGQGLFTAAGPSLVESLIQRGFGVFLDLKFHDIPNTVAAACAAAARLGVWMLNVHAGGGRRMLRAARAALNDAKQRPLLVGVTLLTSLEQDDLGEIGFAGTVAERVTAFAALCHDCGLDGVVCSAHEIDGLRARFGGGFRLVVPGVRPPDSASDDQRRVTSPAAAIARGADYLVIGRPVTRAPDPAAALAAINSEIRTAAAASGSHV